MSIIQNKAMHGEDFLLYVLTQANEKYKGDALLQKRFTVDFLMKKMKTNEGEIPQYYVEHSHEAIINPTEWDMVHRRKALGRVYLV